LWESAGKQNKIIQSKNMRKSLLAVAGVGLAWTLAMMATSTLTSNAAEDDHEVIEEVMKTLHKAPKGVDPVSKKAADGKATPEELKRLVDGYAKMAKTSPLKGDAASWKEKTSTLLAATKDLQAGKDMALDKFREAVNCKACHTAHRPD